MRGARVPSVRMQCKVLPFLLYPKLVAIEPRFAGKAFVQTSQDSLGWVGGVENVKASPVELPSCATFI